MKIILISFKTLLVFTILTGIIYPLVVTGIVQLVFPAKANGSLIVKDGRTIGSELIGQQFTSNTYFTGRPSITLYNPLPSSGSNLGLTNRKLKDQVDIRKQQFIAFNQLNSLAVIPSEMLFASASGLDPHISPEAAFLQIKRIAKARNYNASQKKQLVQCVINQTESPQLLVLGNERINVLLLNLEIDKIK